MYSWSNTLGGALAQALRSSTSWLQRDCWWVRLHSQNVSPDRYSAHAFGLSVCLRICLWSWEQPSYRVLQIPCEWARAGFPRVIFHVHIPLHEYAQESMCHSSGDPAWRSMGRERSVDPRRGGICSLWAHTDIRSRISMLRMVSQYWNVGILVIISCLQASFVWPSCDSSVTILL